MILKKFQNHQKQLSVNIEVSTNIFKLYSDGAEEYKALKNCFFFGGGGGKGGALVSKVIFAALYS